MKSPLFMGMAVILAVLSCATNENQGAKLGPPPGNYLIKMDRDTVTLPFEFYGMNLMIDAQMNGVEIKMLIDNGVMWDELLFYGSDQVDSLGMTPEGSVRVVGAGDDRSKGTDSFTASNLTIAFGDITFYGQSAVITPKETGWAEYFPGVAGQLCGTFFKHFVVEFDFDKQNVILHKPESYRYEGGGSFIRMRRNTAGSYEIPVKVKLSNGTEADLQLSIDLGGVDPVALVISEHNGIERPPTEKVTIGYGASGEITGYRGLIDEVTIGDYKLQRVAAVFTEAENDGDHTNMTIGLPLLMHFNLVFDYKNNEIYLEPNSHFNDPWVINEN